MDKNQSDEISHLTNLLEIYRNRLIKLHKQHAIHGAANSPSSILHSIQECRTKITQLKQNLVDLEVTGEKSSYDNFLDTFD